MIRLHAPKSINQLKYQLICLKCRTRLFSRSKVQYKEESQHPSSNFRLSAGNDTWETTESTEPSTLTLVERKLFDKIFRGFGDELKSSKKSNGTASTVDFDVEEPSKTIKEVEEREKFDIDSWPTFLRRPATEAQFLDHDLFVSEPVKIVLGRIEKAETDQDIVSILQESVFDELHNTEVKENYSPVLQNAIKRLLEDFGNDVLAVTVFNKANRAKMRLHVNMYNYMLRLYWREYADIESVSNIVNIMYSGRLRSNKLTETILSEIVSSIRESQSLALATVCGRPWSVLDQKFFQQVTEYYEKVLRHNGNLIQYL